MIKEALQYLMGLNKPNIESFGDLNYSDKALHIITPPMAGALQVQTLKGMTDAISEKFEVLDETHSLIHVVSPIEVNLIAAVSDEYGRRQLFVEADCGGLLPKFNFGQFMTSEQFIISLQSLFVPGAGDVDYVIQTASSLTTENVATAQDDGISQKTSLRRGVVLKEDATIRARVKLAPYRTFTEVDQPVSEFLFRLRPVDGQIPQCALFEADGGKWRQDAMASVAAWLSRNSDIKVIS